MDEVKRKVYLDLFAAPSTLLPLIGGLTALIGSWAMGGSEVLTFGGLAGVLGGVGIFATRIIWGLEGMTQRAYEYTLDQQRGELQRKLQGLYDGLVKDGDPRTEKLLLRLCNLYNKLKEDSREGRIPATASDVVEGIDQMFHVCVAYLEHSLQLWEQSEELRGPAAATCLRQREEIILEVEHSTQFLEMKLGQLGTISHRRNQQSLSQLRAELDESLRVAKTAEERIAALEGDSRPASGVPERE